jgi:hypothetical protein
MVQVYIFKRLVFSQIHFFIRDCIAGKFDIVECKTVEIKKIIFKNSESQKEFTRKYTESLNKYLKKKMESAHEKFGIVFVIIFKT